MAMVDGYHTKQYQYRGVTIQKTVFGRFETPNLTYGDQPGEYHSFKTRNSAIAFIDRMIESGQLKK